MESENIADHDYSDVVYCVNFEGGRKLGLAGVSIQDTVVRLQHTAMINKLHLLDICFIPKEKLPEKLAAVQPAWILGEE